MRNVQFQSLTCCLPRHLLNIQKTILSTYSHLANAVYDVSVKNSTYLYYVQKSDITSYIKSLIEIRRQYFPPSRDVGATAMWQTESSTGRDGPGRADTGRYGPILAVAVLNGPRWPSQEDEFQVRSPTSLALHGGKPRLQSMNI